TASAAGDPPWALRGPKDSLPSMFLPPGNDARGDSGLPGDCPHDLNSREDFGKLACVLGERVDGDAELLEHRDIKIAERPLDLMLEEAAVAQSHGGAAREDRRIVAGVVGGAGAAAEERHGVVEEPRLTFAGRGQSIQKIGELFGEITVVLGPVPLAVGVGELVMSSAADAQNRREAIADAHAVFGADLVGC